MYPLSQIIVFAGIGQLLLALASLGIPRAAPLNEPGRVLGPKVEPGLRPAYDDCGIPAGSTSVRPDDGDARRIRVLRPAARSRHQPPRPCRLRPAHALLSPAGRARIGGGAIPRALRRRGPLGVPDPHG